MEGPQYISTFSPEAPVMVEGGWTQPSIGEVRKSLTVHQLENHLQEVKGQQKQQSNHSTKSVVDGSKKLYSQPNMVIDIGLEALHGEVSMYIWFAVTPCVYLLR